RVIIIKIADRLHNMITMDSMRSDKQIKIASETLYIYAPLAHRIGLYNIKTQLEDLSIKYIDPEMYNGILKKIKESKEEQDAYIKDFTNIIKESLDKESLEYEIKDRKSTRLNSSHVKISYAVFCLKKKKKKDKRTKENM